MTQRIPKKVATGLIVLLGAAVGGFVGRGIGEYVSNQNLIKNNELKTYVVNNKGEKERYAGHEWDELSRSLFQLDQNKTYSDSGEIAGAILGGIAPLVLSTRKK